VRGKNLDGQGEQEGTEHRGLYRQILEKDQYDIESLPNGETKTEGKFKFERDSNQYGTLRDDRASSMLRSWR
jgi:hypothetical protein